MTEESKSEKSSVSKLPGQEVGANLPSVEEPELDSMGLEKKDLGSLFFHTPDSTL